MRVLSISGSLVIDRSSPAAGSGSMSPGFLTVAPTQPGVGEIRVRLRGELDMLTVTRPRRVLHNAVEAVASEAARVSERPSSCAAVSGRVVCDLDGLDFMAVCGVRMLLEAAEHADGVGVAFVVVASRRSVRRVLELVGSEMVGPGERVVVEPRRPRARPLRSSAVGFAS